MASFKPFRGILPRRGDVHNIVSKPFDNYSKQEAGRFAKTHPESFLNVILPLGGEPEPGISQEDLLRESRQKFLKMLEQGVFLPEKNPGYYLYRQTRHGETHTGIIGALSIDDCIQNLVRPHEQTIEHKEVRLKNYLDAVEINAEPVMIAYEERPAITELTNRIEKEEPSFQFEIENFGKHELWKITNSEHIAFLKEEFSSISEMYIADGHHRTASSVLLGLERRQLNPDYSGEEPWNYFMALLFPHTQIRLREFNRLVKNIGLPKAEFMEKLSQNFEVEDSETIPDISGHPAHFGMYFSGKAYRIRLKEALYQGLKDEKSLPTQILSDFLLEPVLNIQDVRRDKRLSFKGGATDLEQLARKVDSGEYELAFTVNKVTIPQFKKFADNGWFMPPKSTWFEPKLLSALVVYSLDEDQLK